MEPVKKFREIQRKGKTGKETGDKGGGRKEKMNITLLPVLEDYSCVCVCVCVCVPAPACACVSCVNCWPHPQ